MSKKHFLPFLLSLFFFFPLHAESGPPPVAAKIRGTVTVDGVLLTQETDEGYTFEVTKQNGDSYVPPAEATGLYFPSGYLISIPFYESESQPEGANPGDPAVINIYKDDLKLVVTSPGNGGFTVGESGSITDMNLVAQTPCTDPATPSSPSPTGTDVDVNADMDWPDADGATSYDVYFGTTSPPVFVANVASSSYDPGPLYSNTPYYWKIVAKKACGGEASGSEWSFTTGCPVIENDELAIRTAYELVEDALEAEDVDGVMKFISESPCFQDDGMNREQFRASLLQNFADCSNINFTFDIHNININGDVATVSVTVNFQANCGIPVNDTWNETVTLVKEDCGWKSLGNEGSPPPSAPINLSPADEATGVLLNANLDWNDANGATSYAVYFGTTSPPPFVANVASSSYDPTLTSNATYYWRVVAKNNCGETQGEEWSFSTGCPAIGIPSNPTPADEATGVSLNANLNWDDVSEATSYDVYFGTSSPPGFLANVSSSSYDLDPLDPNTSYYWKIVAKNSCGDTSGPEWSFTTCGLPAEPANPSPGDGADEVSNVDLDWDDANGATSYDVYFGTSSPPDFVANVPSSSYDPGSLDPNTTYHWQIVAKNACGDTPGSEWSFSTCNFPVPPIITSPADAATEVSLDAVLDWADSSGADSYDVYFDTNNPPTISLCTDTTASNCDPGTLDCDTTYYWRVVAKNSCGDSGGPVWSFTTQAPQTYNVGNVQELEEALAEAQACDTVQVAAGSYQVTGDLIVPEEVKLIGENWYVCTIELGSDYQIQLGSYSTLAGLTINSVSGTRFRSMVLAQGVSSVTINNNVIHGNPDYESTALPAGIFLDQSSGRVENNTVDEGCVGIRTNNVETTTIVNNIVVNNEFGWVDTNSDPLPVVNYNDFWNNDSNPTGADNISANPLFVDAAAGNYHLQWIRDCADIGNPPASPCIDSGDPSYNDKDGSRSDMGADGGPQGTAADNSSPAITEASADPMNGNAPLDVDFTGNATDEWDIACWSWDFGDGTTATGQNPNHTYDYCGGYIAELTVTDHSGNSSSTTIATINVDNPTSATASASPSAVLAGIEINFTGSASGPPAYSYTYSWDFGDGHSSSNQDDSNIYTTPGAYTAILTVTDDIGDCPTTATVPVTIIDGTYDPILLEDQLVTSAGGTVGANGIEVEIPAGALSEDTVITICELDDSLIPSFPTGISGIALTVDFGPDGCDFTTPVTITIPYTQDDLDAAGVTDPHDLKVYYLDTSTIPPTWVEILVTNVDEINSLISGETTHFTIFTLGAGVPTAPTNLSATAVSTSQINLNWTDTSSDEDGFTIERSDDGGVNYTQIDTVDTPNATSYASTGLSASTTYWYQVRAYNASGASDPSSAPANATTGPGGGGQATKGGGPCFIATAAFGTPMAKQVRILSLFRDEYLLPNSLGNRFVELYYKYSPPIADYIAQYEFLRKVVRVSLWPLIAFSLFMLELGWLGKLAVIALLFTSTYFLARSIRKLTMYRQLS